MRDRREIDETATKPLRGEIMVAVRKRYSILSCQTKYSWPWHRAQPTSYSSIPGRPGTMSVYTRIWWLVKLPNSLVTSPDPKEDDIDAKIGLDVEEQRSFGQYRLAGSE